MMEGSIFRLFLILFIQETSQHESCCLKKEVNGIEYEHIYDHGMLLPSTCNDHCVYKKVGEAGDNHYCFGEGQNPPKCLAQPECGDSGVFVAPAMTDRVLTVKTTDGGIVYGPWSNERLSAFQFEVVLDNKNPVGPGERRWGTVGLSFSPCYECNLVYKTSIDLHTAGNGKSVGYLVVNDRLVASKEFDYVLGPNAPAAKFLVQTFPQKKGKFKFIMHFLNADGTKQDIFDYVTSVPEDGFAPFGITYAVFGGPSTPNSAATYTFNDVDRAPEFYPIADCREGENTGLTAVETDNSVTVKGLAITEPVDVRNVDSSQLWCVISNGNPCPCPLRGHVQANGPEGTVINKKTCKFLKASVPSASNPGTLSLVDEPYQATKFQFIVAPNTEINQLRFGDNNVCPFTKYVVSWNTTTDFDNGVGIPVTKIGRETNPLTSCFKAYKFLSNVQ